MRRRWDNAAASRCRTHLVLPFLFLFHPISAQLLLTPNTTRSIWSFKGITSNHSTNNLPSTIPQPPPIALGYYTTFYPTLVAFQPVHLNGRDQYIDLLNPLEDGGSRAFTGPVANGTKSWTLATWLYVESLTHAPNVNITVLLSCSSSKNPSPPHDFMLVLNMKGEIGMRAAGGYASGYVWPWISNFATMKEWVHIGIVFDQKAQLYSFYYNGVLLSTLPQALFGLPYDTQAFYCKLGQSDLTVVAKDMQPFRGAFFAFAFYQELLTAQDMWALSAPRSAKAILQMTIWKWRSWSNPPAGSVQYNALTVDTDIVWSQYSTLSFNATSLDLSQQSPNPAISSNTFGGTQPWTISWWQQLPGTPSSTQTIWSFTNSSSGALFTLTLGPSAIQCTHSTLGVWNAFTISNGLYGGTTTPVTQWALLSLVYNTTGIYSYLNSQHVYTAILGLPPARAYSDMYLGKANGAIGATFVGKMFGWSVWNSGLIPALDQPEIAALAEPTSVTFDVDGPTIVTPGSTIVLTISMTSLLKPTPTTLVVQGGASTVHDALLTTATLIFLPTFPQTVSFLVPLDVNTYTITFKNSVSDPLVVAPQTWCVQVVDATPALIVDVGLTSFTASDFLASSDYHLELSATATLPSTPPSLPGPSGMQGQNIITFDGVSQYLDLNGSSNTMPFPGINDLTSFTVTLWVKVLSVDAALFTPIFYHAANASSDNILFYIEGTTKTLRLQVTESTVNVCIAISSTPFPIGNEWHHVTTQMGNGGCSVYIDGQQSLSGGNNTLTYTSPWLSTWQPLQQQLPHAITRVGMYIVPIPPINGSIASFDMFQRTLTPREVAFLAANKPTSLLPPLPTPRIITVPNVMSAAQLYNDALLGMFSLSAVSPTYAPSITGPNTPTTTGGGGYVWKLDNTTYGIDMFSPFDTISGRGPIPKPIPLGRLQPWSVGMWLMPDQTLPGAYLFNILSGTDSIASLTVNANAELVFNLTLGSSKITLCSVRSTFSVLGKSTIFNQQWIYVHAVYDPLTVVPTCAVYVDGRMAGISQMVNIAITQTLSGFVLGGPAITAALSGKFYGQIASFIFFIRSVTKQEIFILGTSPPGAILSPVLPSNQPSPAARILANSDFDWMPTGPIVNGVPALDLSGGVGLPDSPRVLIYSGLPGSGYTTLLVPNGGSTALTYSLPTFRSPSVTVSLWASFLASTGCFFYAANSDSSSIISIQPRPNSSLNVLLNVTHCDPSTSTCVSVCQLILPQSLITDTIYHIVAMVADDGRCKLFINGILTATSSGGDLQNAPLFGVRNMIPYVANVGACAALDPQRLNGKVAQLTIWQRELSEMEIVVLAAEPPLSIRSLFPSLQQYRPSIATPVAEWTFERIGANYNVAAGGIVSITSGNNQFIDLLSIGDNPTGNVLPSVFGGFSQSFTISMWIQIPSQTIVGNMQVLECSSADNQHQMIVTVEGYNNYGISSWVPSYGSSSGTPQNTFVPSRWHLFTIIFDSQTSTLKVMVNSAVIFVQGSSAGLFNTPRLVSRSFCRIGSSSTPTPRLAFSVGYVTWHNIALKLQDVTTMYRNPPANVVSLINSDSMINRLLSSAAAAFTFPSPPPAGSSPPSYSAGILTFTPVMPSVPQFIYLSSGSNPNSFGNGLPEESISNFAGGGLTVTMWLKFSVTTLTQRVFDITSGTPSIDTRFSIQFDSGQVTIVIKTQGQSVCTLAFTNWIAKVGSWNLYTIMLFPDARGMMYVDTMLKDNLSAGSMQCISSSQTNTAQTLLLPLDALHTSYFGGDPNGVDGTTYRGFSGSLAGLNYFTRQLLPSEITLLYQNPPVAGLVTSASGSVSTYSWKFQLASSSTKGYTLTSSKNIPGTFAKFNKNMYLNLTNLADRPLDDKYLMSSLGGVLGRTTVFSMWARFDGFGNQALPSPNTPFSLFDFSIDGINSSSHMALALQFTAQNQTILQFDQTQNSGGVHFSFQSPPGIIGVGEWKLITLVMTLGSAHPTGSNVRLYVNAGLVAWSSYTFAQSIPTTKAVVNQNPFDASSGSGLPISLAEVTIINSTDSYTHAMVWKAWQTRPQALQGSSLVNSPADQLLRSAAALFTCPQRPNDKTTKSVMDWVPGRSVGSGLCVFDDSLNSSPVASKNGSYWDLTNPSDNPDHTSMPEFSTDPLVVGDGSGFTFSFHMSLQSVPGNGEAMPLLTCRSTSIDSDDIYITMEYQSPVSTSFTIQIVKNGVSNPAPHVTALLLNSDIPTDQVIHLAVSIVSIDSTPSWQAQIHFNGRLVGSTATYSGFANALSGFPRGICFFGFNYAAYLTGSQLGASNQFLGSVGQIAFFSRGLSLNEIKLLAINPPAAYVAQTSVTSVVSSGEIDHYTNRPMTCGTRTFQQYQSWDNTNTAAMSGVSNLPAMQCTTPSVLVGASYGKGRINSTVLYCLRNTGTLPVGEGLSYIGLNPSAARIDVNPIWLGIDSTYVRTQILDIIIYDGLTDYSSYLTPPSAPLSIFTYQMYLPVLQSPPIMWMVIYCVSPCAYYYKGVKLVDALNRIQLPDVNVGVNVVQLYSSTPQSVNYSITIIIPPINPCLGIVCGNGGTCLPQTSPTYPENSYTCQCVGLWTGPNCLTPIPPAVNPPVAVISVAQSVTDCDTLFLDGRQSYNLGPASVHPYYIWNIASVMTSKQVEIWNKSSTAYNQATAVATFAAAPSGVLNSTYVFTTTSTISFGGVKLIDNCTYTFTLRIVSDIDASTTVSAKVKKGALASIGWTPSVTLRLPSVLKHSDPATATILLTPSLCLPLPADLVYMYTWTAQMTGALNPPSTYYPAIANIPISQSTAASQASSFIVPAGFWRTGYTYTIMLNLFLSSASGGVGGNRRRLLASQAVPLIASATGLRVTSTTVIAKITNGDRTRANTDELIITADQSYDPDFPLSTGQSPLAGVKFMWSCRVSGGGIGCALPATVNLTRPSVTIPPSTLSAGFSYIWSVNVTSIMDGRWSVSSSVNVTLTVPLTVSVPLVTILAPPTRINIDDELRVQATVVSETTNPIVMSYVWSIIALDNSSLPAAVSPLPSLYDPTNLANGVGVNTSSLVLLSNRLVSGIYRLTVTVTDPFTIDPVSKLPVSGYANIVFRVNSKPQPGECHISATTTTGGGYYALLTPFSVVCSSWYSNTGDEPFTYQIGYATSEAVAAAAAAANAANTPVSYLQLTPESFAPTSVQFFLPAAGSFIIRATIKDQVGSEANVDLPLTVDTPIVVFDLLEYIRNLTEVELPPLVASGSTQSAMLLASRIGDLINGARVTMSSSGSGSSSNGSSSSDSSSSSSDSSDINAAAQDRLTLYNRECLIQLSLTWKQIMIQTQNIIDLASMNLIIQAMLPLTKYASSSTTTPRYYSNDTLTVALQLIGDVITAADLSTMTHKILSISTTQDLGTILSQLFVECSSLDFIDHSLHTVLHIRQRDAVAGEEISLSTLNFIGFVSRSLVSAGTEVHLSNGQSVILTSKQMETYVAQLEQLNSTSIDTASYPLGTAEMDTRIITFASQWNQCRNKASLSQLTSIELTFPNGDPIDIGSLGSGITFTLPLPKNVSDPILQLIQDDQRRQYEERCGTSDGFIPTTTTTTNVTEDELLSHFQCQFYNTTTHQYSSDGCTTLNATRVDPPGLGGGGGVLLTCQCTHLTEFAILYQEAQSRDRNDGCPATATSLGDSSYLIFLVLYALVGLAALIQLIRSIVFFGVKKYWLITIEHTLMFLMCLARSYNMAMYYSLYTKLSIFTQSLLSGIPYLFYPWIFTFVIVAWASVLAAASQGQHRSNLFKPYAVQFILGNSFISLVIFFIFISMAVTNDLDTLTQLQRAGIGVTCAVEIGFAIFFVIYGGLLVHELTKTFVSKHALRLGVVAGSLASAFAVSAALLAFSVAAPDRYGEHFIAYNCVYFSLDIVGLLIVMGLFAKSISRAGDGQSKTKEISSTGGGSSHRTGTNGAKTPTNGRSTNGSSKNGGSSKKDIEMGVIKREPASKLSVPRALPTSHVSSPIAVDAPYPSPSPPATEQDGDIERYTPPEEQMIQLSPPQSPHHQLEVNDSSAPLDEDDDVSLPPRPDLVQLQHQSTSPPPLPSSMATPASPSFAGSKRPPPPIPQQQQQQQQQQHETPASPSHAPAQHDDGSLELDQVQVEQNQLQEDDF